MSSSEVVYIAGVCVNENTPAAKAGLGGWYGIDNHKQNFSVPLVGKQTQGRAEIHALIESIRRGHLGNWPSMCVYTDHAALLTNYEQLETWKAGDWAAKPPNLREWMELDAVKSSQKMQVRVEPFPKAKNVITGLPTDDIDHPGKIKAYAAARQAANRK